MAKELTADQKMKKIVNEYGEIVSADVNAIENNPEFMVSLEVDANEPVPEFSFPTFTPPQENVGPASVSRVSVGELNKLQNNQAQENLGSASVSHVSLNELKKLQNTQVEPEGIER